MFNYVCRLCLLNCKPEESVLFSTNILEMIEFCVPEFDVNLVNNPVMCSKCQNSLKISEQFKRKCIEVQDHIKKFKSQVLTPDGTINLPNLNKLETLSSPTLTTSQDSCPKFRLSEGIEDIEMDKPSSTEMAECIPTFEHNNYVEDDEVTKIMNNVVEVKVKNFISHDDDDEDGLLNLLDSSSNTKTSSSNQTELYLNFYDDESGDLEMSASSKKNNSKSSKDQKSSSTKNSVDNLFDVKFEKYFCKTCDLDLFNISKLLSHLYKVHHRRDTILSCVLCRYKSPELRHIKTHYSKSHSDCVDLNGSCVFCVTNKKSYRELLHHMRNQHNKFAKAEKYGCNSCDFSAKNLHDFRKHFFQSHDFICNYCLRAFDSFAALNRHIGCHSAAVKKKKLQL